MCQCSCYKGAVWLLKGRLTTRIPSPDLHQGSSLFTFGQHFRIGFLTYFFCAGIMLVLVFNLDFLFYGMYCWKVLCEDNIVNDWEWVEQQQQKTLEDHIKQKGICSPWTVCCSSYFSQILVKSIMQLYKFLSISLQFSIFARCTNNCLSQQFYLHDPSDPLQDSTFGKFSVQMHVFNFKIKYLNSVSIVVPAVVCKNIFTLNQVTIGTWWHCGLNRRSLCATGSEDQQS